MLLNGSVVKALRAVGVDPVGLVDFMDYVFGGGSTREQERGLSFDKLVELICELGGSNKATVKDIVDLRQVMTHYLSNIDACLNNHMDTLDMHVGRLEEHLHRKSTDLQVSRLASLVAQSRSSVSRNLPSKFPL